MADLFAMSDKILSEGVADGPINRINFELSELGNDVAMVEAFSHSIVFATDDGLVVFDTSVHQGGKPVVNAIKGWRKDRFNSIVYTHGHLDHVGGSGAFLAYEKAKGNPAPSFIGHENVPARFNRYQLTDGYNSIINTRQFQSSGLSIGEGTT